MDCLKSAPIKAALAPMAAITHSPFRLVMQRLGAGYTVSELISASGIIHGNQKTREMLFIHPEEVRVGIQLFGENPDEIARALETVQGLVTPPTFIDLNLGCPVTKVVQKGAGSALLRDLNNLKGYFTTIRKHCSLPLSAKIRTGFKNGQENAVEVCALAADCGLDMITIHGRTREQQYRGLANWEYLHQVAQSASIPVVGNGDLTSASKVHQIINNVNNPFWGVMIGRGALTNPFIFRQIKEPSYSPTAIEFYRVLRDLSDAYQTYFQNPYHHYLNLRKHAQWFSTGMPYASQFRIQLFESTTAAEVLNLAETFFSQIHQTILNHEPESDFMMSGHG